MRKVPVGKIAAGLAVVLVLGAFIGWLAVRSSGPTISMPVAPKPVASVTKPKTDEAVEASGNTVIEESTTETTMADNTPDTAPGWEQKLDDILLGPEDEAKKAEKILALMEVVPGE